MIEIYQPLRIYTAQEYQLREKQVLINHRPIPTMYVDREHLLPFIVRRIKSDTDEATQRLKINFTTIEIQNIYKPLRTYDILSNLAFDYGIRTNIGLTGQCYDYALYKGVSTISALPQGTYQLYLKDEANNEFWSEIFRIYFPKFTVKFEYRNSTDLNDLWFWNNMYYTVQFETITYSTGEYDEFLSVITDNWSHNVKTKQRKDEIWAVDIFADTKILGALHTMKFCDTIYLTDESGQRNSIEITEIISNNTTSGGHAEITIKYRVVDNMLKSTKQNFTWIGGVVGTDPVIPDYHIKIGGKYPTVGGKKIKL